MTFVLKDEAELQQWLLRRLGAPLLKVELTEEHLRDNIEDSKRWFSAHKGFRRFFTMRTIPGKASYTLPPDADMVMDVAFSYNTMDTAFLSLPYWEGSGNGQIPYSVFNVAGGSGGMYSSYMQTLQYIESTKKVMSAEQDWRQEGRELLIFPQPNRSSVIIIEYASHTIVLSELTERDHELLKRYALALAKRDLGRIRSKYDSYPTAQGTVSMDGATLLEEAATEIETLMEEIAASAGPMGFLVG